MNKLKPCPFCGGDAYEESYDRFIQIGCRICNYHMSFNGVLQTKINTGIIASYTIRCDGVKIPFEYYDAKAYEKAYKKWNRRAELTNVPDTDDGEIANVVEFKKRMKR